MTKPDESLAPPPSIVSSDPELARNWSGALSVEQVEAALVRAIHAKRLPEVLRSLVGERGALDDQAQACVDKALSCSGSIASYNRSEAERLASEMVQAGAPSTSVHGASRALERPFHAFELRLRPEDMATALAVAEQDGYLGCEPWRAGEALQALLRTRVCLTLAKTDRTSTRVTLRWRETQAPGPWSRALRYMRRVRNLFGWRADGETGPYLGTPTELIPALLDFAQVTASDVVMDLGCGDGRILVEAAQRTGCQALGVEQDTALVEAARHAVEAAGLERLVEVRHGDMADVDLGSVTVAFCFLPFEILARVLPTLRGKLRPGARIIAHEQAPLHPGLGPDASKLLVGSLSLTVAHRWSIE